MWIDSFKWHIQMEYTKRKMHTTIFFFAHMAMAIERASLLRNRMNDDIDIDGFILRSAFFFFFFSLLLHSFGILAHHSVLLNMTKMYLLILHISWKYLRKQRWALREHLIIEKGSKAAEKQEPKDVKYNSPINISLLVVKNRFVPRCVRCFSQCVS